MNKTSNQWIRSISADPLFCPTTVQGVSIDHLVHQPLPEESRSSVVTAAISIPGPGQYIDDLVRKFKQALLTFKQTLVHQERINS